jgi:hypothetical protein
MENAAAGRDPLAVMRDSVANESIVLPFERDNDMNSEGFVEFISRMQVAFSPIAGQLVDVFKQNYKVEPALV